MEKQSVTTTESPTVILEIAGDLRLKGQDELEVVAKSDTPENLTLEAQDDQVTIRCSSNCNVRVPRETDIQIKAVHGNA